MLELLVKIRTLECKKKQKPVPSFDSFFQSFNGFLISFLLVQIFWIYHKNENPLQGHFFYYFFLKSIT